MVKLITYTEYFERDYKGNPVSKLNPPQVFVSSGVYMETGTGVCLPVEPLSYFKDKIQIGEEWYV